MHKNKIKNKNIDNDNDSNSSNSNKKKKRTDLPSKEHMEEKAALAEPSQIFYPKKGCSKCKNFQKGNPCGSCKKIIQDHEKTSKNILKPSQKEKELRKQKDKRKALLLSQTATSPNTEALPTPNMYSSGNLLKSDFDLHDLYEQVTSGAATRQRTAGLAAQKQLPFSIHADYTFSDRNVLHMIEKDNKGRIEELISLRYARLSQSPSAFFRGTAGLMAHDLSLQACTDVHIVICGDAHLGNFGFYASPERRLVFDLNDFDEAAPGPWEWDLKRLATSIVLNGKQANYSNKEIREAVKNTMLTYRSSLSRILQKSPLDRFYVSFDEADILKFLKQDNDSKELQKNVKKAKRHTSNEALEKITALDPFGRLRFIENPPVLTHVSRDLMSQVEKYLQFYRKTVRPDVGYLLSQGVLTDIARRVVGVGSVGTRCYVAVVTFEDSTRLILQVKEARPSVLSRYVHPNNTTPNILTTTNVQGKRVMTYQQILQAVSDPFLGYFSSPDYDFYVRQFRDMKGSINIDNISYPNFIKYTSSCAIVLARAHAQSSQAYWIDGYLTHGEGFDQAMAKWAFSYAQQVEIDYKTFLKSIESDK